MSSSQWQCVLPPHISVTFLAFLFLLTPFPSSNISTRSSIPSQYPLIKQYTDLTFYGCFYSVFFWQLQHTCISEDMSLYMAVASAGSLAVQTDTTLDTSPVYATLVSKAVQMGCMGATITAGSSPLPMHVILMATLVAQGSQLFPWTSYVSPLTSGIVSLLKT